MQTRTRGEYATLAVLLLLIALNAMRWVFAVPLFQAPDEDLHFDYVMTIYSAGRLVRTSELPMAVWTHTAPTAPNVHPVVHHLAVRVGAARMRSVPSEKVPPGYGTRAFWDRVNATMPPEYPQLRNPWLVDQYPFGYYALVAAMLRIVSVWRADPVTLAFAGRLVSVLLLVLSLLLGYAYLRRIGTDRTHAMALVAIAGFFPFTDYVASYIQPENLSLTMVTLVCALSVSRGRALWTGLALAGLLVTKYHFFLVVLVAIVPMLLIEARRRLRALALLAGPCIIAAAIQMIVQHGSRATWFQERRRLESLSHIANWPAVAIDRFRAAIINYYGGGTTFRGFWGVFGWNDTPLVIGSESLMRLIRGGLVAGSLIILGLVIVRLIGVARRLLRIARTRPMRAACVAFSNPLANAHIVFAGLMLVLYVWLGNTPLHAVARNWFPFVVSVFWFAVIEAPRALPRRMRRLATNAIVIALSVYTIAAAIYAIPSVRARFYF